MTCKAMSSFTSTKMNLPLNVLMNCILVKERVRPALLVQPIDYDENTGKEPKTKQILESIKTLFPELLHSEDYQGILISYEDYNGKEIDLQEMGRILGYPCYADFGSIDKDAFSYAVDITVLLENGERVQLFANVCKDTSKESEFESIAKAADAVLKKEEYTAMFKSPIKMVNVEVDETIPVKAIINKIIKKEKLPENYIWQINNIFYNFGFSFEFQDFFLEHFQKENPVHNGILLSLLLNERNNTLSAFYPLQRFPDEEIEVTETTTAWEKDLKDILLRTKI